MGLKDKLAMISHHSGNGFCSLLVNHEQILKLRRVARELKEMVSDENVIKIIDEYLNILDGIINSKQKKISKELFDKIHELEKKI